MALTLSEKIKKLRPKVSSLILIYDSALTAKQINPWIKKYNPEYTLRIPGGEKNKTAKNAIRLSEELLKKGIDRNALILVIGGGATSDLVGFVASIVLRGVRWATIPTTLLSMVDASIGGKTGVNACEGKNMIGTFHFPEYVHVDLKWLKTLPKNEMLSGCGELLKTSLLAGGQLWRLCLQMKPKNFHTTNNYLAKAISLSSKYKTNIVKNDPLESNNRQILNFGHTFGHAIEMATQGAITHGVAVAHGINCALRLSYDQKLCKESLLLQTNHVSEAMGLPKKLDLPQKRAKTLEKYFKKDKKLKGLEPRTILLKKAGEPMISKKFSISELANTLFDYANQ